MYKNYKLTCWFLILILITGCSTSGRFRLPADSDLYINDRYTPLYKGRVNTNNIGVVKTRPFFWSAASGIPYKLKKDGVTIKEGKLKSKFRVVSIFWPPFALIYWPIGLSSDMLYDLINDNKTSDIQINDK